jgi:xanthine dehydrogenase accessory factor
MHPLRDIAVAWLAEPRPAVLVEVVATRGSVPREAGTRMLVSADRAQGTIGGGHLELQAIAHARALLSNGPADPPGQAAHDTRHFPLGPALGQCCGGTVTLRFERLSDAHLAAWPEAAPRFHLQLYGAGHVGRAIARLLATLPVTVDWIDGRDDEFPTDLGGGAWPAHIRKCPVDDALEAEVAHAPSGAFYLVLTHRHDLDLRLSEAILRRGDFGFFGLIGSHTERQRFLHQLEARGITGSALSRMTCPIGLPGIDGKAPEVIAVAVVAQLLMHTNAAHAPAA